MKAYPKYKDSGIEWIGCVPEHWKTFPLKWYVQLRKGNKPRAFCDEGEEPYVTMDYLRNRDNAIVQYPTTTTGLEHIDEGDVLVLWDGANAGEILRGKKGYLASTMAAFSFAPSLSPEFMFFFLKGLEPIFKKYAGGTTIPHFDSSILLNYAYPLPPLDEQYSITEYLESKTSKLDECVRLLELQKTDLTNYRNAIIAETVTRGLNRDVNMSDSGIPWIGLIPDGWDIIRVKYLLEERKVRSINGLEEPLSMSQKYGLIPTKEMDSIPNMATSFVGAKLVYVGDLVFNKLKAHLGVFSVSKYDGLVSPDYAVYYSNGECNVKFLEYLFKTDKYITEFKKLSTGVGEGLTRLYTGSLFGMYAVQPPISEQQAIVDYLDGKTAKIDEAIKRIDEQIADLRAYRTALISDVVTGKIDVRNN